MGKSVADAVLDAALSYISSNVTQMSACSTQPTTYGQATTTGSYMLAIKTGLTSGNFTGPADDTSGRKITVNAQSLSLSFPLETQPTWLCAVVLLCCTLQPAPPRR